MAYLVKPVKENNLFPAMEIAMSRFKDIVDIEQELLDLRKSLETRKILDRAKGLLMDAYGLTEQDAFRRIQQYSMTKRTSIRVIAEAIIASAKKKKQ